MGAYNVKVLKYADGKAQVRIYTKPFSHSDLEPDYRDKEFIEEIKERKKKEEKSGEPDLENSNRVSKNRTIQEIYNITRSNVWEWFVTLTFNPKKVDSFNYDEVVKHLTNWLKNLKKRYAPDLKYIIVPELHKSGRYHFHGLFASTGNIVFVDSGKTDFDGSKIYNIENYKLGFTTASKIKDLGKACSYVSKYITKELFIVTKNRKRYWHSKNINLCLVDEYLFTYEELQEFKKKISGNTTYTKTQEIPFLNSKVQYWELEKFEG